MHLISATLIILIEIMTRVYVEEEIAIESNDQREQLLISPAYFKRQVMISQKLFCRLFKADSEFFLIEIF